MFSLYEDVGTVTWPLDRTAAYAALLSKLSRLRLPVEQANAEQGKVVVRCLTPALSLGFWRCWADRLVFQVKEAGQNASTISIRAIPNLMRFKTEPGEALSDLKTITAQLAAPN